MDIFSGALCERRSCYRSVVYAQTRTAGLSNFDEDSSVRSFLFLSLSFFSILSPPRGLLGISREFLCSPVRSIERHMHDD